MVKVKQSHYRPGQDQRVPGSWGSQFSRQSAHEGGKVVSPTHQQPLPWVDPRAVVRPEDLCQWKIQMTPPGIGPTTLRLVAQCLSQLCHRVPRRTYPTRLKTAVFSNVMPCGSVWQFSDEPTVSNDTAKEGGTTFLPDVGTAPIYTASGPRRQPSQSSLSHPQSTYHLYSYIFTMPSVIQPASAHRRAWEWEKVQVSRPAPREVWEIVKETRQATTRRPAQRRLYEKENDSPLSELEIHYKEDHNNHIWKCFRNKFQSTKRKHICKEFKNSKKKITLIIFMFIPCTLIK
jgi:hypothetical protein